MFIVLNEMGGIMNGE